MPILCGVYRPSPIVAAAAAVVVLATTGPLAQSSNAPTTDAERERFLKTAKIIEARPIGLGVTNSVRATLSDGTFTHDAHVQTIDDYKTEFKSKQGVERNFRDSWRFNVAAYKIDRLLGLQIVPVTVERRWKGDDGAFTWWIDDVLMDERKRLEKQILAPNITCWSRASQALRLFDALIENIDRNLGNTVISKNWRIWAIDHTRAFRGSTAPRSTAGLTMIDRDVLKRLEALDFATLKTEVGRYIGDHDIRMILSRRNKLVTHYKSRAETALYDRADPAEGCDQKDAK